MTSAVIRLSPDDNVVVCCRTVAAGEPLTVDDVAFTSRNDVPLGHKLALVALEPGDKVIKYGMAIGSMVAAAAAGEWVHVHNMKSDYLPAHHRDATRRLP